MRRRPPNVVHHERAAHYLNPDLSNALLIEVIVQCEGKKAAEDAIGRSLEFSKYLAFRRSRRDALAS